MSGYYSVMPVWEWHFVYKYVSHKDLTHSAQSNTPCEHSLIDMQLLTMW